MFRCFRFLLPLGLSLLTVNGVAGVVINAASLDDEIIQNTHAHLQLSSETCETPDWKIKREYRAVDPQLRKGLRAFGYYSPQIKKQLLKKDKCWHVVIDIDVGQRVIIDTVDIVVDGPAAQDTVIKKKLAELQQLKGKPLKHADYEAAKSSLQNLTVEQGYLKSRVVRKTLRVDPEQLKASIEITIESGKRFIIGEINYSDQPLNDAFLRKLAGVESGQPLQSQTLIKLDRNLTDSGYFSRVEVVPLRDQIQGDEIPLKVDLMPRKKHSWRGGVGFVTDTGARISGAYESRFFNTYGHQWNTSLTLSQAESEWLTAYEIPGNDPHREKYYIGMSFKHEDVSSYVTDSLNIIGRQTLKKNRWTEIRSLELLYEDFSVAGDNDDALLLMPGVNWQYQKADNPLKVTRGHRFSIGFKGAWEGLISTQTFLQMTTSAKFIRRMSWGGRITGRGDFGTSVMDNFNKMPVSLRFFAGGDNSVRGYDYESLGPVDSSGEVVGGNHLLTGSIEYDHPLVGDTWWGALFVDAGNAFDDFNNYDMKVGYGAGVRWFSPIGKVRLDFAVPEETGLEDWKIHFSFGTDL